MNTIINLSFCFSLLLSTSAYAIDTNIVTDGTLTNKVQKDALLKAPGKYEIPQSFGAIKDGNLFHSFDKFNIAAHETATFTNDSGKVLTNVISRVTGGQSFIYGTLQSTIPGANFYFINPNGVTFGANAKIDVPAAFYVSTADSLKFAGGAEFSVAAKNDVSSLTVAEPASFGFLTNSNANILIKGDGNDKAKPLTTSHANQNINLVAGNITIKDAKNIAAKAGSIHLIAVGKNDADTIVPINGVTEAAKGSIIIDNSKVNVSGDGSGYLQLNASKIEVRNRGQLLARNSGATDASTAQGIKITTDRLTVRDGKIDGSTSAKGNAADIAINSSKTFLDNGEIFSDALENSSGDAGFVSLTGNNLTLINEGWIRSDTLGSGNAGGVKLSISGSILSDSSYVSSDTYYDIGHAGFIDITANRLNLSNAAQIGSSAWKYSSGNAGDVVIKADTILVDGQNTSSDNPTRIDSVTYSTGNAGTIDITSKNITVLNGGQINSSTENKDITDAGDAGFIYINSPVLKVLEGGQIKTSTANSGLAGDIVIDADKVVVEGYDSKISSDTTYVESDLDDKKGGDAGFIFIKSNSVDVLNGGQISSNTANSGFAGDIAIIEAKTVTVAGNESEIATNTNAGSSGEAGIIWIDTDRLDVLNQGWIHSDTNGTGDAGDVSIETNQLSVDNGYISSDTYYSGNAGAIWIKTDSLTMLKGGQIGSSAFSIDSGYAGSVTIKAADIVIDGQDASSEQPTRIDTLTYGFGDAGIIDITSNNLSILNGGKIVSDSGDLDNVGNEGNGGDIFLDVKNINLTNASSISTDTHGLGKAGNITLENATDISLKNSFIQSKSTYPYDDAGDAGNIAVNFSHWLTMARSFITTEAITGNGGTITINGGELIYLQNSGFKTSVEGATSNGGNINVKADALIMETGVIQANAVGGSGGDINILLKSLIPSQNHLIIGGTKVFWQPYQPGLNVIQAASESGVSGAVNVSSPQFDISGSVSGLDTTGLALPNLNHNSCESESEGTRLSSLTRGGKGGVPLTETEAGFIPAVTTVPKAELNSGKKPSTTKASTTNSAELKSGYPCAANFFD